MSFESGKSMAGSGALLLVIGAFVPLLSIGGSGASRLVIYTSPFLSIAGIILLFVGMKNLADYYHENNIFSNARYAVIFGIMGMVAVGFFLLALMFGVRLFGSEPPAFVDYNGFIASIGAIVSLIPVLIVALVFYILMAVYFRKSVQLACKQVWRSIIRNRRITITHRCSLEYNHNRPDSDIHRLDTAHSGTLLRRDT